MALINTSTKKEFEANVLKNDKFVLVDFWAPWCPPCRMMAPVLEAIAKDKAATLDIVKVDTEASAENQMIAAEYGVRGIPNMQLFKDGKIVEEFVGMRPEHVFTHELEDAGVK